MELKALDESIKTRAIRIGPVDLVEQFRDPVGSVSFHELREGRRIQLAPRHPEALGHLVSRFKEGVGNRDRGFHTRTYR